MKGTDPKPYWAFEISMGAVGDLICAGDKSLPIGWLTRLWWTLRGNILYYAFDWMWRWE